MSVDANVLINERIRRRHSLGRSPIAALDAGSGRASTIVDANLTTLIKMANPSTCWARAGEGFRRHHQPGIVTSMFTAIVWSAGPTGWLCRTRPAALKV
jgi:preprotein translocase subunit SecD